MQDSIFTKIIKGEIPCYKIYEDERTLAFLDIHPASQGHTLVIPKTQVEFVWDLSPDDYTALMQSTLKVARHLKATLNATYIGEAVVGTDVPHAHVHLVPFETSSQMRQSLESRDAVEPDNAALAAMAEKLRMEDAA